MTAMWPDAGDLQIEVSRSPRDDVEIVTLQGSIDMASVARFKQVLSDAASRPLPKIIVQCRGAGFINSGGMGALYACHCTCREAGGGMVLCGASGKFQELICTIGLDQILLEADSADEALAMLDTSTRSTPTN